MREMYNLYDGPTGCVNISVTLKSRKGEIGCKGKKGRNLKKSGKGLELPSATLSWNSKPAPLHPISSPFPKQRAFISAQKKCISHLNLK